MALAAALPAHATAQHAESGDRDAWQRPELVMDALGVRAGSRVADVGAGTGYFTFHLARRVGPTGRVYAVDVNPGALEDIAREARGRRLENITIVTGTESDPRLPADSLDMVLVVNTYHELRDPNGMLQGIRRALKPRGLLAVIDADAGLSEGPDSYLRHHRISSQDVLQEATATGFRFVRRELGFIDPATPFSYWFFMVFERTPSP
jgi:ubiquinone/menaquinone biosynthesis C-methylase UbiE